MSAETKATLKEAIATFKAGNQEEALRGFLKVLESDPTNEAAMLWIAAIVSDPAEKRRYFNKVLSINPDNGHAKKGLAQLTASVPRPTNTRSVGKKLLQRFFNEEQDPQIVEKVHQAIQQILTQNEKILYIAVQEKPLLNIAPDSVILTNRRFIIYKPKVLGGVSFNDYIWHDLRDARLQENFRGAVLTFQTTNGSYLRLTHLPKAQARRVYALAQEMEEKMRAIRRVRTMEEKRAAAGGITIQGLEGLSQQQRSASPVEEDPVAKLQQLKKMVEADLISQQEYDAKKAEILGRM